MHATEKRPAAEVVMTVCTPAENSTANVQSFGGLHGVGVSV